MAAHPRPPLLPRLHARVVCTGLLRTSSRAYIHGDHAHAVCQASPPKSSIRSCDFCLHEGSPVGVRAYKSSLSKVESSIVKDFGRWESQGPAQSGLDEASALDGGEFGKTSTKSFADRRIREASGFDETCTSKFTAAVDAASILPGSRLQTENVPKSQVCSSSYCLPIPNASTFLTSDAVDAPKSLSPTLAVSSQTRSKVVRTAWEALVRWSRSWQLLNARKATNVLQRTKKVVVVGGGSFGTAMAVLLARNKSEMQVSLLLRDSSLCDSINNDHVNRKYFPKHILPDNIVATTHPEEAFKDSEYCIHAVPVQYSADFLKSISEHVPPSLPFFSVSKGLELSSLEMMSQVIPRALGNQRQPIAVISGPSFSIELMNELPTAMVVASKDKELARAAQQLLASRYLRINTSSDVVGVEIAGALKNVLAIAAGIVEGMNLGNNCMAALVAQGCSEIRWLAEKMGAKSTTLAGLSGTGDIMLTCFVNLSRNRSLGVRLGSGESLSDILSSMNQVAEGVPTAGAVIALARKYRVQMPVLTAVARILENELTPKKAVLELMSLPQVEEV